MPPSASGLSRQAVGWALLSQAIWLPLLGIVVHDRWLSAPSGSGSAGQPPGARAEASTGSNPAQAPPLSLRDLELASRSQQAEVDPAAAATNRMAPAAGGLVLRSPAGGTLLRPALPVGLPAGGLLQQLAAAGSGAAQVAVAPGRAAGSPGSGVAAPLRPGQPSRHGPGHQSGRPPERSVAARAGSRSARSTEALEALPLAGAAAQRSLSRSQLLGGAMGLRDLSGAPIGAVASLRPGAGQGQAPADRRAGQEHPVAGRVLGGRPANPFWAPPPPLPPLP